LKIGKKRRDNFQDKFYIVNTLMLTHASDETGITGMTGKETHHYDYQPMAG
jgi:hypothetical protein